MSNSIPFTLSKISMINGTSRDFVFNGVVESTNNPFNFRGCNANFSIIQFNDRSGNPVVSKDMTVADDGNGADNDSLFVSLTPSDTINLTPGRYVYQVSVKDPDGNYEAFQGYLDIFQNVNESYFNQ